MMLFIFAGGGANASRNYRPRKENVLTQEEIDESLIFTWQVNVIFWGILGVIAICCIL